MEHCTESPSTFWFSLADDYATKAFFFQGATTVPDKVREIVELVDSKQTDAPNPVLPPDSYIKVEGGVIYLSDVAMRRIFRQ